MIDIIMTDGSTHAGLVAINWADKYEHLVPRINAEYGYRPKNNLTYPFGKNIFKAIIASKIGLNTKKEDYSIKNSDITLFFITNTKRNIFLSKMLQNKCLLLNKPIIIVDINKYDLCDIGTLVSLINVSEYKIINISGKVLLNDKEEQLISEFLTIMYMMLKKKPHDYSKYIAYERD